MDSACQVVDLLSKDFLKNPYGVYAQLRNNLPLCQLADGTYVVSRFEDVQFVLKRTDLFSSGWSKFPISHPDWVDETLQRGWFISEADPPEHTKHRAVVKKLFMEKEVKKLAPAMEQTALDLLNDLQKDVWIDFLDAYAFPYVAKMSDKITGINVASVINDVRCWVESAESLVSGCPSLSERAQFEANVRIQNRYFDALIQSRSANPQVDLVTELINAQIDGVRLSKGQLYGALNVFMIGAIQAPAQIVAVALSILANDETMTDKIGKDPDLIPAFIEEILRLHNPSQGLIRTTKSEEAVLSGGRIPANSKVLALIGSANRDPSHFSDPDEIQLERKNLKGHLGLGHGVHICIGEALARLETKIALEKLLPHVKSFECPKLDQLSWVGTIVGRLLRKFPAKFNS